MLAGQILDIDEIIDNTLALGTTTNGLVQKPYTMGGKNGLES
jgi:hypothetical protein